MAVPINAVARNYLGYPFLHEKWGAPGKDSPEGDQLFHRYYYELLANETRDADRFKEGAWRLSSRLRACVRPFRHGDADREPEYEYIHIYAWITQDADLRVEAQYKNDPDSKTQYTIPKNDRGYKLYVVTLDKPSEGMGKSDDNYLQISFMYLGAESSANAQVAAMRIDLTDDPEPDEYGVFVREGLVVNGGTEPVEDQFPGMALDGNLESTTYLYDESIKYVKAVQPTWQDNLEDGGGEWTTETIEGVTYDPASGTASPGETVTVTATADSGYELTGKSEWTYTFHTVEPEPEPDPEPGDYMLAVTRKVCTILSVDVEDDEALDIVKESVMTIAMLAYAYCRGQGFTMNEAGQVSTNKPDITAAITAAAARYTANPTGLEYRAGTETVNGAFSGWTLAEQYVLNNYRKRWA